MIDAFALGTLAQSSLLLAGLLVCWVTVPRRLVGVLAGFGARALISAVSFDLILEAEELETGGRLGHRHRRPHGRTRVRRLLAMLTNSLIPFAYERARPRRRGDRRRVLYVAGGHLADRLHRRPRRKLAGLLAEGRMTAWR